MSRPFHLESPILAYGQLTITKYGEIEGVGREAQETPPCIRGDSHEAPHPGCVCGISMDYRFKSVEHDRYRDRLGYRLVTVGVYELWGRIVFHGSQVSAQYARLAAIYEFEDDSQARRSLIATRAQIDGIPVLTYNATRNGPDLGSLQSTPLASTARRWSVRPNALLSNIWTRETYDYSAGFLGTIRYLSALFVAVAIFVPVLEISGNALLAVALTIGLLLLLKFGLDRFHARAIADPPYGIPVAESLPAPIEPEHQEQKPDLAKEIGLSE